MIANLDGISTVTLTTGYDRREQEISLERLIFLHSKNYVAQHHTRFSSVTEMMIGDFDIKPVMLVRNIFDIVASFHDHFYKEGTVMPMAFLDENFLEWDKTTTMNFITDMVIPWYFNFYSSWTLCEDKLTVRYEDLISNPAQMQNTIARFSKISCTEEEIEKSILLTAKQPTRKNVGKKGRGQDLDEKIKEKNLQYGRLLSQN